MQGGSSERSHRKDHRDGVAFLPFGRAIKHLSTQYLQYTGYPSTVLEYSERCVMVETAKTNTVTALPLSSFEGWLVLAPASSNKRWLKRSQRAESTRSPLQPGQPRTRWPSSLEGKARHGRRSSQFLLLRQYLRRQ